MSETVAAFDCGTNTIKLLVADLDPVSGEEARGTRLAGVAAESVRFAPDGRSLVTLHGETVTVDRIANFINAFSANDDLITFGGPPIPIAAAMDDSAIRNTIGSLPSTPLEIGMRETMDRFAALRDGGRLDTSDLI